MRGLKIQDHWIKKILSEQKTMEVRSVSYNILGQRIALGNSGNGLVEGYATVQEVIRMLLSQIPSYENQHRATEWLLNRYQNKEALYGYCLIEIMKEKNPFSYPKSGSIWFTI